MPLPLPHLSRILSRGCKRGLISAIREEGWGFSVGSLFGVLVLAQVLLLLVLGVNSGLTLLREQTDLRLEILETATPVQIQDLIQGTRALPYVEEVIYITRQEAYERQRKRDPQLIAFLQKFGIENPFPETLGVRLASLNDYDRFTAFLKQPAFASTVNPTFLSETTDQETQIYRLLEVIVSVRLILFAIVGLLLTVLVFIIIELVRRRALLRREELFVEQLVGATPLAILIPFCTEILTLLLLAFFLSVLFAGACVYVLPMLIPSLQPDGVFAVWSSAVIDSLLQSMTWIIIAELILLPVLAALGTFIALWPRLKNSRLVAG